MKYGEGSSKVQAGRIWRSGTRALVALAGVSLVLAATPAAALTVVQTIAAKGATPTTINHAAGSSVTVSVPSGAFPNGATPPAPAGVPTFTWNLYDADGFGVREQGALDLNQTNATPPAGWVFRATKIGILVQGEWDYIFTALPLLSLGATDTFSNPDPWVEVVATFGGATATNDMCSPDLPSVSQGDLGVIDPFGSRPSMSNASGVSDAPIRAFSRGHDEIWDLLDPNSGVDPAVYVASERFSGSLPVPGMGPLFLFSAPPSGEACADEAAAVSEPRHALSFFNMNTGVPNSGFATPDYYFVREGGTLVEYSATGDLGSAVAYVDLDDFSGDAVTALAVEDHGVHGVFDTNDHLLWAFEGSTEIWAQTGPLGTPAILSANGFTFDGSVSFDFSHMSDLELPGQTATPLGSITAISVASNLSNIQPVPADRVFPAYEGRGLGTVWNKAANSQDIRLSDPNGIRTVWIMDTSGDTPVHLDTLHGHCAPLLTARVDPNADVRVLYEDCQGGSSGPEVETWDLGPTGTTWSLAAQLSTAAMDPLRLTEPWRASLGDAPTRLASANSATPDLSEDGRFLVFASDASDLVRRDTNGVRDIFHYDHLTNQVVRITQAGALGTEADGSSFGPAIDDSGQRVVFASNATNLATDTNGLLDIYLRDLDAGAFTRVSLDTLGGDPNGLSRAPAISGDGGTVVFASDAPDLVAGDTNGQRDVFAYDVLSTTITRVSVATGGTEATGGFGGSDDPTVSANGRYVVFTSSATNLVGSDLNGTSDVFLHDRQAMTTERVSLSETGTEVDGFSGQPSVSADGRYVAFENDSSDIVAGFGGGLPHVFLRDRTGASTTWISDDGNGDHLSPRISNDGRYVVYSSESNDLVVPDTNGFARDVFLWDRLGPSNVIISRDPNGVQGNSDSGGFTDGAAISGDGTIAAFESAASNLIADDGNGVEDVFLRDLGASDTHLGSTGHYGAQPDAAAKFVALSGDGEFVAYSSAASNLVPGDALGKADIYVAGTRGRAREVVSVSTGGALGNDSSGSPALDGDGSIVAFDSFADNLVGSDLNATSDVFVRDRTTNITTRVSVKTGGVEADNMSFAPSVSTDGRWVAFLSYGANLEPGDLNVSRDVFIHDRDNGTTEAVSKVDGGSALGDTDSGDDRFLGDGRYVSDDGRYVAFGSDATNLHASDTNIYRDIFVRDRTTSKTILVSQTAGGVSGNLDSDKPAMTRDGRFVAFVSDASDLVGGDGNAARDVFVADLLDPNNPAIERVSIDTGGLDSNGASGANGGLSISDDGRYVYFSSQATDLIGSDTNGVIADIYVRDRTLNQTTLRSKGISGGQGDATSDGTSTTGSGLLLGYESNATDLVHDDGNGVRDVLLSGADTDGDGSLDQFDEFPTDASESVDTDSDGTGDNADLDDDDDGVSDADEHANQMSPIDAGDAALDFDGDGFTNGHEIFAGTDPNDAASFPMGIPTLGVFGGLAALTLLGVGAWAARRRVGA